VLKLLLVVAIAALAIHMMWRVQRMPPHKRRSGMIRLILMASVLILIVLSFRFGLHWVGATLGTVAVFFRQILPLLIKGLPFLRRLGGSQSTDGPQSAIQTNHLAASLDHETGNISGEVTQGQYEGWRLDDLNSEQLKELLAQFATEDQESAELLRAYMAQRSDWENEEAEHESQQAAAAQAMNSRAEALATLGLDDTATEDDIISAHRSLIQKLHPDRGGNDYLAAKINQAKDFLLND
jgi:hypothetical protein